MRNQISSKELQTIPGVGQSIAQDLIDLGYTSVSQLKGANPESMFEKLCSLRGQQIDRCVLYAFRCAVYFANSKMHDSELLKWWNWKDRK